MALRKAHPVQFSPSSASDAIDGTNVPPGAMAALTNLIPDPTTKNIWVCRPAAVQLTSLLGAAPSFTQGFVSAAIQVGTRIYGMVSTTEFTGHDIPFSYNTATNTFDPITGLTALNTPSSPPATGAWTPPIMCLIGTYVVVTHPGFAFGSGFAFGTINVSNPNAPAWTAQNTTTTPLSNLPSFVANFNGRAYFLVNPPTGQPFVLFTDINNPLSASGAGGPSPVVPVLTFGDNQGLVAAAGLGLFNQLGGIVQSLMVFKAQSNIYQITGDIITQNLTINALNVATGTSSPLAIATTPRGLAFLAPDGMRLLDFFARISDPIGVDGDGINTPFLDITIPSRAVAGCNQNVLRVTVQNGMMTGAPQQDWWYDISRKKWSGPHTFPASLYVPFGDTFIMTPIGVTNALFQSDVVQTTASQFTENGVALSWKYITSVLPDPKSMSYFDIPEATLNMALTAPENVSVMAIDQAGNPLGSVVVTAPTNLAEWGSFTWGVGIWGAQQSALFPRPLNWAAPVVGRRMQFAASGLASGSFRIGDLFMRVRELGYMQAGLTG